MKHDARQVLDSLVQDLDNQTVVRFLNQRLFADELDIPCRKWSFLNQMSVFLSGTIDARGIRQWQAVGRHPKSKSSAFYILVPLFLSTKQKPQTKVTAEKPIAFKTVPVFRVEDTEGKPLAYEVAMQTFQPESLPLFDVAQRLGIQVQKGLSSQIYGSYSKSKNTITLNSAAPTVFLHELSHAIDEQLPGKKKDKNFGEIVAELSAAFLGSLYGCPPDVADVKAYLQHYTGKGHFMFYICKALLRVEAIYAFIQSTQSQTLPVLGGDLFPDTMVARRKLKC